MENDKFVMFLDILGFSQLVLNNTPEQLKQIYDSELHQTAGMCTVLSVATFGTVQNFKITANSNNTLSDVQQKHINLHVMSDSLIAWTNDKKLESLTTLCQFAATYLSMTLSLGLPHRGAISIGDIQFIDLPLNGKSQTNVVGAGVVKPHNYEVGQEWMGCVVDPECITEFSVSERHDFFSSTQCPVLQCSPPYKAGAKYKSDLTINWTLFQPSSKDRDYFEKQFSRNNKGIGGDVPLKINNTYEFHNRYCNIKKP